MSFTVEYYEKNDGECPTREFLDSLSPETELPFVIRNIGLLEKYGYELRRPYTDIFERRNL